MKISVLLPTRNRRELLRCAILSVLSQDYSDWEILVSDNASEEDVASLVSAFDNPRIIYSRSSENLAVTDNWNRALAMASGDYFVMLGDDDFLLPGALGRIADASREWASPDFFFVGALEFAYPGVVPRQPDGFVSDYNYSEFIRGKTEAFLLPTATARRMAHAALNFRLRYGFNMQFFVFRMAFAKSLESFGPFFQSPFPDYYAANVVMLLAQRVVVLPDRAVAIGISPKSYGFYHLNNREKDGMSFLSSDMTADPMLQRILLPGSNINTSWAISMVQVKNNLSTVVKLRVGFKRYRRLQIFSEFFAAYEHDVREGLNALMPNLSLAEKIFAMATIPLFLAARMLQGKARRGAFALLRLSTRQYITYWRRPVAGFPTSQSLISAWQPGWEDGGPRRVA